MWGCDWDGFSAGTGGWDLGFGILNGFFVLLVLFVLIYVLYRLLRSSCPIPNGFSDQRDSLNILKSRLAKGEISLEEYWQMHQVLASHRGGNEVNF